MAVVDQRIKYSWGIALLVVLLLLIFQVVLLERLYQLERKACLEQFRGVVEEEISRLNGQWVMSSRLGEGSLISFNPDKRVVYLFLDSNSRYIIPVGQNEAENDVIIRVGYDMLKEPWTIGKLDTLVGTKMRCLYRDIPYRLFLMDSTGRELESCGDVWVVAEKALATPVYPLGYMTGQQLAGYCYFSWLNFWYMESDRIIVTMGLFLLLAGGIFFLIRTIVIQKRMANYREDFMHILAHDLKSPLNFVRTAGYVIREKAPVAYTEEQQRLYGEMEERLNRMTTSIQRLLVNSVGLYGLGLVKKEIDLKAELEKLVYQYRLIGGGKIVLDLDYELPERWLTADPLHFMGAIANLVDNAVKYAGEEAEIRIRCRLEEGRVVIRVKDNGPGIPECDVKQVFRKYYRVGEKQRKQKGFGLGLNYVWNVVKAHKGKVELKSGPGKGCEFIIILPCGKKSR